MIESLDAIAEALESIPDPFVCSGAWAPSDALAIEVPGAGKVRLDAKAGPALEALSEPAPFGDGARTREDPKVRRATRVRARGAVRVHGFEPRASGVLDEVEQALSPREKLTATLLDVHVYGKGGHFVRHKDTPRDLDMVGTLVVGLPIPHRGGAFRVIHGRDERLFDWRGAPGWVAFHGDVDHVVEEVTRGYRVTLAYALSLSGVGREASSDRARPFRDALQAALADRQFVPRGGHVLVPCARMVISSREKPRALELRHLRGLDRDIAAAAESLGLPVLVRACLAFSAEGAPLEDTEIARLERPIAPRAIARLGACLTIEEDGGESEAGEVTSLAPLLAPGGAPDAIVMRRNARWTLVHEALFSPTGYFGNEHFDALVYDFAAIEIAIQDTVGRGLEAPRRVAHAKFGVGTVLSINEGGTERALEVRFADGTVKKLLERVLRPA